jgi:hypothetical protein
MRRIVVALIVVTGLLLAVPAGLAKDFRPGDLRACGRDRCVRLVDEELLRALGRFYYGQGSVARAPRVALDSPGFVLRFRNGYASGIVAGAKLGRFQSYGVICGRFQRGRWYRVPPGAALALRRLTADLRPARVPRPPRSC